jgi:hypothetical protein
MMLRALADFACEVDGELIFIRKGVDRVSSDWPGLADSRHLFEEVEGPGRHGDRSACRALDATGKLIEDRRSDPQRGR